MTEQPRGQRRDPNAPGAYALSGGTRRALAGVVEDLRIEEEIVAKRFYIEASQEFADSEQGQDVAAVLLAYLSAVERIDGALRADTSLRARTRG